MLTPETSKEEAEALAAMINTHCLAVWGQFYSRTLEGNDDYDIGNNGLAILD